jgi:hypothetical protein
MFHAPRPCGYRAPPGSVNFTIIAFGVYGLMITQERTKCLIVVAMLGTCCFISFFMILTLFDFWKC